MKFLKQFPGRVVIALAAQFILGMYIAMYVEFPDGGDTTAHWEFARTSWPILVHIALGAAILVSATAYLVVVLKKKQKQLQAYAIGGLVAVFAAFLGGERFVSLLDDGFSMLMAIGFISALVIYAAAARVQVSD